jgi:hypothetical protein
LDSIPDAIAATVLAKCGRRCCICRRFKPIQLQVHHIVTRATGGSNELDNLIALCLTCHTDVHTKAPFTRRFTDIELKLHRDALYKLVEESKFPAEDEDVSIRTVTDQPIRIDNTPALMAEAINLLVSLATGEGRMLAPAAFHSSSTLFDRHHAAHHAAFDQLCECGFLKFTSGQMYMLTFEGFNAADVYISSMNQAQEK